MSDQAQEHTETADEAQLPPWRRRRSATGTAQDQRVAWGKEWGAHNAAAAAAIAKKGV